MPPIKSPLGLSTGPSKTQESNPPSPKRGTSQGSKTVLPPKTFIREELIQFGTMGTPSIYFADLDGSLAPFQRQNFDIPNHRFAAIHQSLLLSKRMLGLASPYLSNFLPLAMIDRGGHSHAARLQITEDMTSLAGFERAKQALDILLNEILPVILWNEDKTILPTRGAFGVHHTGKMAPLEAVDREGPGDWEQLTRWCIKKNLKYRPITITLASQMIDAILASNANTEQHMNALFAVAINIVHEIGHAIYSCNMKNRRIDWFWVGNDIWAETGHSLIAWLFNGWLPEVINISGKQDDKDFLALRYGHCWHKFYKRPCRQPFARVAYSMPMAHIQRLFSEEAWNPHSPVTPDKWNICLKTLLEPEVPFKIGMHARKAFLVTGLSEWQFIIAYDGYSTGPEEDEYQADVTYGPNSRYYVCDYDWDDAVTLQEQAARDMKYDRVQSLDLKNLSGFHLGDDGVHTDETLQDPPGKPGRPQKASKNSLIRKILPYGPPGVPHESMPADYETDGKGNFWVWISASSLWKPEGEGEDDDSPTRIGFKSNTAIEVEEDEYDPPRKRRRISKKTPIAVEEKENDPPKKQPSRTKKKNPVVVAQVEDDDYGPPKKNLRSRNSRPLEIEVEIEEAEDHLPKKKASSRRHAPTPK